MSGENVGAGYGWIEVSVELIRQALHMPETCEVVGAEHDWREDAVCLLVRSPELSGSFDNPPTLTPTITHKREEFVWDWNAAEVKS